VSTPPFRRALDYLHVEPAETLMVGDWPERDVVGAANLGIRTVFARYGNTFVTVDTQADYDIDDIKELTSIVEELNSREGRSGG
jgi:putative hydrolase of the HAD superfamily